MKPNYSNIRRATLIVLFITVGEFIPLDLLAQPQPAIPRLKGVGIGPKVKGSGTDVQVVGSFAYLAWSLEWGSDTNHPGGLEIYSLTNPTAPVRVGGLESRAAANGIFVSGHYAYLAEGTMTRNYTNDPGVLEIVDVRDPNNPVPVSSIITVGRANDIRVANNLAYLGENTRWTGSNLLGALEIFDVSTPTNPVRVAIFDTAGSVTSIDVSGNYVYLADGVTDLQILDVSDPHNPQRVGVFMSNSTQNACGLEPGGPATYIQVLGNLGYSAGYNGLEVLDISDPSNPVSIGDNFCMNQSPESYVSDHYAFCVVYSFTINTCFLSIVDTSDPANLVTAGLIRNWCSLRMCVVGDLIYPASTPLSVYEISHQPAITFFSINGETVALTWDFAPGFVLQRTSSLTNPQWSNVPVPQWQTDIELPMTNGSEFFRLARP